MKSLKITIVAFVLLFTLQTNAQVSINVNIGSRPDWCNNYNDDVEYVYLPEIECYYDMHSLVYIYYGPQGWIRSAYLPDYCHDYDFRRGYRVELDYRGNSPYAYFNNHRSKYYRNYHRNYRQEYYRNNYENRREYVTVNNHHNRYENYNSYRRDNNNRNDHRNNQGRDHGRR